jgi:hypothetical protein
MEKCHYYMIDTDLQIRNGMVVRACNPSTWKLRQEDQKFKVSLGYIVRPCLKK